MDTVSLDARLTPACGGFRASAADCRRVEHRFRQALSTPLVLTMGARSAYGYDSEKVRNSKQTFRRSNGCPALHQIVSRT